MMRDPSSIGGRSPQDPTRIPRLRAKLDCGDSDIDRWSKRFTADRPAGLFACHAGRERYKVSDRIEARVLAAAPSRT